MKKLDIEEIADHFVHCETCKKNREIANDLFQEHIQKTGEIENCQNCGIPNHVRNCSKCMKKYWIMAFVLKWHLRFEKLKKLLRY